MKNTEKQLPKLYTFTAAHWIGNHNYSIWSGFLVCKDGNLNRKLLNKVVDEIGCGLWVMKSVRQFDYIKIDDGGFHVKGYVIDWVDDYQTMIDEWSDRAKEEKDLLLGYTI